MTEQRRPIFIGAGEFHPAAGDVEGEYLELFGEQYYRIRNFDRMPPFFMSVVSSSDHWLFIASTGGLSAGRINAESALFPYYTDDKITENAENTGSKAAILITRDDHTSLWEPFSLRGEGLYRTERNLYKNVLGDKILFEEINLDLRLTYRYAWRTSDRYGLVRTVYLKNDASAPCDIDLLDGIQNILPFGATTALQTSFSNLLNGYKRNELEVESQLAIFALSSTLTDQAKPSESLMATTAWQSGLDEVCYLLSSEQLDRFRRGLSVEQETDLRGRRGAFLLNAAFALDPAEERSWSIVVDVDQDSSAITTLLNQLQNRRKLTADLETDIDRGSRALLDIVAAADGLQQSADRLSTAHHYANTLFNTMRGGIFAAGYQVDRDDLLDFLATHNRPALEANSGFTSNLPEQVDIARLCELAAASGSTDLERLCREYLPLTFSRRHGDPSRPWNVFSINLKNPDGRRRLDYQGNWRDIFQNWEPLACAYPEFVEGMICKFLNATTADGYNPYRVTREGIEWESPDPSSPWANIGYWSDHQIIYLEKLLELSSRFHPGALTDMLAQKIFSHADVPYRIRPYVDLLADWYETIDFDWDRERQIADRVAGSGTDGKLILTPEGEVFHVNLAEKLLLLLLAKLVNFVPEGGIWMNTQRPEWNDANNALVGKGLSVVTACYLRRFVAFFRDLFAAGEIGTVELTCETAGLFTAIRDILQDHGDRLHSVFDDRTRRTVMDALGQAGSDYRWNGYRSGFSGEFVPLDRRDLDSFLEQTLHYLEHTLRANRRSDGLYHAYNILQLGEQTTSVGHLYEMLEGQVAILSSGMLSGREGLDLLGTLRNSALYRQDQHSYILYPDRDLPGFLRKNFLSAEQVKDSALLAALVAAGDPSLILRDENGAYHFNGRFRNAKDVARALDALAHQPAYAPLIAAERRRLLDLFEATFDHQSFTGRSGTFFAFEGLGSIYWHMVSKLLLAAQEIYLKAVDRGEDEQTVSALAEAYYDIRRGIGFNKSPAQYGAFPTDPYSHTPAGQGAKQPGMTGQVKEELLTRLGELGLFVEAGSLRFDPHLLRESEFSREPGTFTYIDVSGEKRTLSLPSDSLAFTLCQVPIVYIDSTDEKIEIQIDGQTRTIEGKQLDVETCKSIFKRDGSIVQITIHTHTNLKQS